MSSISTNMARVPDSLQLNLTGSAITRTQQQLLQLESELNTGNKINSPSDDPSGAALIQQLQKSVAQNSTYLSNLQSANSLYSVTDSTLTSITNNVLASAQSLASSNASTTVSADARQQAAPQIQSLINQMLSLANTQYNGVYIFGSGPGNSAPFVANGNGIQYTGSAQPMSNSFDASTVMPFTVSGGDAFGSLDAQVTGAALSVGVTGNTRVSDLGGANQTGVHLGAIQISDGTNTATVDLSNASDLQDVISTINASGLDLTASIGADNQSLLLTPGTGTDQISVKNVGTGTTATDLGILQTTPLAAGSNLVGQPLDAKLTSATLLSSLNGGAGISSAGLLIGDGTNTTTVAVPASPTATVQDLLNAINNSANFVNAQINSDGTGINVVNATSGRSMTIGENGGTTAADLGIRSFSATTPLAQLNGGKGVGTVSGADFQITKKDGTTVSVDLTNETTVQDVINTINTAAGYAMASFATTGNGIVLTDNSASGTASFAVTPLNFSTAASDLGLTTSSGGTNTITGKDVNPSESTGIFADLNNLLTALQTNDTAGITAAATSLAADQTRLTAVSGMAGAQAQAMQHRQDAIQDQNTSLQTMLTNVQGVDYTTAVAQFTQLQTSLQAALAAAGQTINQSLLDYLS